MKPNRSGNCKSCGTFRNVLHRDHIVPRHKGGSDDPENIQMICANCHQDKTALELRALMTGRKLPEDVIQKMSASRIGKRISEEAKKKIGSSGWTEERKKKISESKTGRHLSEETKEKIRNSLKGRPLSDQHRERVCAAIARRFNHAVP